MSFRNCLLVAGALAILAGCATSGPSASKSSASGAAGSSQSPIPIDQQAFISIASTNQLDPKWLQTPTNFFRLGPGDLIEIEVLGEPTTHSFALVGPDGKIYYNLLPGLFVWGLSLSETKQLIDQRMQEFFKDRPQVAITLRSINSRRAWVLGGVQAPGVYPLATPMTLLEVISLAGGTVGGIGVQSQSGAGGAPDVDLKNSFLMRNGVPLPVDLDRLLKRGDLSQNVYVEPGDFVYLRPSTGRSVYIMGAVGRPGMVPYVQQMSLASALINAGGPVRLARIHEVAIVRGSLSQPTITTVDYQDIVKGKAPDVVLESGDIVYIPFVAYRKLAEFGESILRQFVSTIALNEGINSVLKNGSPVGVSVGVSGASTQAAPSP